MPEINEVSPGGANRRIARGQMSEYDRIMHDHYEARECGECEACMEFGIQVFKWILKADEEYRREVYANPAAHDEAAERELEGFMRKWHARCEGVITWAKRNAAKGFKVVHLDEFRQCCEQSTAIVESFDDPQCNRIMGESIIVLRDQALLEHRDGETAPFI